MKEKLTQKGYSFKSQTDTEAAVKLVDYYYKKYNMGPVDAISRAMMRIRGSYALCVMFKDFPGEIYCARSVYYIGNMEIAKLENGAVTFYNIDSEEIQKPLTEIKWDAESAEKVGYGHFMLKEEHDG